MNVSPATLLTPECRTRSLVDFGHGCEASVVAEGVETAEDAATLRSLDVDHEQGWHFGRPGPVADLAPCPPRVGLPRPG
jgi:EAL domain-containing protein (putative c-di-GMP-specific phosphodiesterase class I)